MKALYLIRHGKTEANLRHAYCGSTDLPLSAVGRAELREKTISVDNPTFFTSGMRRTEETLEILFGTVPHTALPEFREVDFGVFEMHTYEELRDREDYQRWITGDNERNVPPGGESGAAMTARGLSALPQLMASPGNLVLVTHGGVIAAIMAHLFPEEHKNRYQWQSAPGSGYVIENGTWRVL